MANKRTNKAFTLIEILVVVGIIALLAGIGAVAFSKAKKAARMHTTKGTLAMIGAGAEMFKNDFGVFPPSDPTTSNLTTALSNMGIPTTGDNNLNSGAKIICALLTGYADDASDTGIFNKWVGTSTSDPADDGAKGFGFRTRQRGKVHGPYGGAEAAKTKRVEDDDYSPKVFVDGWNHAILYYKCNVSTSGTYSYDKGDNQTVSVEGKPSPTPYNTSGTDAKFNDFKDARKDFLLVSPGDVEDTFNWDEAVTNASAE